jgi:hypothetical protein
MRFAGLIVPCEGGIRRNRQLVRRKKWGFRLNVYVGRSGPPHQLSWKKEEYASQEIENPHS